MTMTNDVLTKGMLLAWLGDLPNETNIALEIKQDAQLDFIVTDVNGQDRILRIGVFGPYDDEQTDPDTNEH
jgi:hypothetical protein